MSENLSDNLGPKTIYQLQGKKDGYRNGKTIKFKAPPLQFLGQNVGEKFNIYNRAKKIPNPGAKLFFLTTPYPSPTNYRARIFLQNFNIYTMAKRMVILRGKLENYKPPLSCSKNMPHDFFAYGLF